MRKILVVGPPGAGKSEFSRQLHNHLGIPLYPLDLVFWKSDRTHVSRDIFDRRLAELLVSDEWILDGDYSRTYEVRLQACDTFFFLDIPLEVCMEGAASRIGKARPDFPWVEETFDPEFRTWIVNWFRDCRPALLSILEKYHSKAEIVVFRSRREISAFLTHYAVNADEKGSLQ